MNKKQKKSRKGQIKIQETAFMLVAVLLFFILAGLFVVSVIYSNLREQATDISADKTYAVISNLANSAEFSCSISKPNCVDADKVLILTTKPAYEKFWQFSSLKIIRESGLNKKEDLIECKLGNYPNCDELVVFDKNINNVVMVESFIALCRKENNYDKCEIAIFEAGYERK